MTYSACIGKKTNQAKSSSVLTNLSEEPTMNVLKADFPYDLDNPVEEISLPNKLKEISGLGIDSTGQYLYAIQDEEGDR